MYLLYYILVIIALIVIFKSLLIVVLVCTASLLLSRFIFFYRLWVRDAVSRMRFLLRKIRNPRGVDFLEQQRKGIVGKVVEICDINGVAIG